MAQREQGCGHILFCAPAQPKGTETKRAQAGVPLGPGRQTEGPCGQGVSRTPTAAAALGEVLAGSQVPGHRLQQYQYPSSGGFPGKLEQCLSTQG